MNILQQQQQKHALKFDEKIYFKIPPFLAILWLHYKAIRFSGRNFLLRKPLLIFIETDEQYILHIHPKKPRKHRFGILMPFV